MATMKLSFEIFAPREIIFDLLTNPGHLREWFPAMACETREFTLDATAGGAFSYRWGDVEPQQDCGTFTQVTAPEGYSATVVHDNEKNRKHALAVRLTSAHGRTQIEVTEDGFTTASDSKNCSDAWAARLQSMKLYLSSI